MPFRQEMFDGFVTIRRDDVGIVPYDPVPISLVGADDHIHPAEKLLGFYKASGKIVTFPRIAGDGCPYGES